MQMIRRSNSQALWGAAGSFTLGAAILLAILIAAIGIGPSIILAIIAANP
jgi:hypothetical protein